MQSAQINSPRFAYQTATPAADTLDDFRVVRGNYAGSFSGKSKQPLWIAAAMIAAIGGTVLGVNLYAGHDEVSLSPKSFAPASTLPSTLPTKSVAGVVEPTVAPIAKSTLPVNAARDATTSPLLTSERPSNAMETAKAKNSATAKSALVTPKKAAPIMVAPANKVAPPQQEIVPSLPPNQEPLPTPTPITEEKLVVPAPAPLPNVPQVEPPKL